MGNLLVLIGTTIFKNVRGISIKKDLDALCSNVSIDLDPSSQVLSEITANMAVSITCGISLMFTGYIDQVEYRLNSIEKCLSIRCRDKTCDLIECSVIRNPMGFERATLESMARDLASPFKIQVTSSIVNPHIFPSWFIHQGETVFDCLERAAQIENALLLTSEDGKLVISKPTINSDFSTQVFEGENLIDLQYSFQANSIYSSYQARGYSKELGNTSISLAEAKDDRMERYRPFVIDAQGLTKEIASKRVKWEKDLRYSRAHRIEVTVPNWVNQSGNVHALNTLVDLKVLSFSLSGTFLISGINFSLSAQEGFKSILTLIPPTAFFADPSAEMRMNAFTELLRLDRGL